MSEFEDLRQEILNCQICKGLIDGYDHPITSGNQKAKIMQIGQAPSRTCMMTGKAFDDASGKKLLEWYAIKREEFDNPDNFYIAAMAKCYPGKSSTSGDNPPPKICAQTYMNRELEIIEPEMYIVIGSYAAKWFFPKEKLTDLIFQNHTYKGKPLYVIPHPSPLNRRWLKAHPEFEKERIIDIRNQIHKLIHNKRQ